MRILLLCTGLKTGGAEQQVAGLAQAFIQEGHDVAIVSLTPGCEVALPARATIVHLNMRKTVTSMMRALLELNRFVRQWQPQIIHAHMVHANLLARVLAAVTDAPPVICTAHSAREGGRLRMLAYRLTDRWAALNSHVSESARQAMIDAGAVVPERIVVVPNGIDTDRFLIDPELRQTTRKALGLDAGTKLVVNVGRLVPEKAQLRLIHAFSRMIQAPGHADTRLLIAGEGTMRSELEMAMRRHDTVGSITLAGNRRDIPALLNAADLFVLSSDVEGMPLVVGEALACGCPVVATDAAGVAELVGDAGTIVSCGDTPALARAMSDALAVGLGTPAEQARRYQRVLAHCSLEAVARSWLARYAALANAHGDVACEGPT
ncbi:glycosyltransferase [Cupriavidus sp. MP-37]|uniref:glycosyltransferase n=1 Tax=Cupriavidus sp. MP-37 TaxID=2884455 RepID=UPI001D0BDDC1|nr:glycosyltransferase [Cupriavidus sp. MP-37]UDM51241.1 glycosyltransferase [Cupriavidus sp. MP-37]